MNKEEIIEIAMQLISYSGIARSNAMQAMDLAKEKKFSEISNLLQEAKENLILASQAHFSLIQKEAQGKKIELLLLLIHAEDQLLTAQTLVEMVEKTIELFKFNS